MFLCLLTSAQGQVNKHSLSKFEKQNINIDNLVKKFNFKATDTLICLNQVKYISIKKDSIILYKIKNDKIIFKKTYSKIKLKNKLDTNFLFDLNPIELTFEKIEDVIIEVNDGSVYSISIYKNDKYLEMITYSPETYIDNKFPYYEKRRLFLDCFKKLDSLFIDDLFIKIQNEEEIFIKFLVTNYTSKKVFNNKNIIDGEKIYNINNLLFSSINNTERKIKLKSINKKLFIDSDYLNQFLPEELRTLLLENKKNVYD